MIAWHKDKGLTVSRLHRYDHTLGTAFGESQLRSRHAERQREMENRGQGALVDWKRALVVLVLSSDSV